MMTKTLMSWFKTRHTGSKEIVENADIRKPASNKIITKQK